jgi:leucyl aminopeptidase (aminopeptidase T)
MSFEPCDDSALARTAHFVLRDVLCLRPGETLVITADTATDPRPARALAATARAAGGLPTVVTMPQLPFQGALSDPFIPEPVAESVRACDVWLDLTFPYMSGSCAHAAAMTSNRVRSLNLLDLGAGGIVRLFGTVDFDRLFALQDALDALIAAAVGREGRVRSPRGTDVRFTIAKPATRKLRHIDRPGTYTPPGSAVIYPEPDSVRGMVVIDAAFHEHYTILRSPITLTVDGRIRDVSGGGADLRILDRALRRAGGGAYGSIIHFSHGFHPAARFTGRSFNEDIRVQGHDAIGFGIPWWLPGGGENHPDGVVTMHSLWIDGEPIADNGALVAPTLARLEQELHGTLH